MSVRTWGWGFLKQQDKCSAGTTDLDSSNAFSNQINLTSWKGTGHCASAFRSLILTPNKYGDFCKDRGSNMHTMRRIPLWIEKITASNECMSSAWHDSVGLLPLFFDHHAVCLLRGLREDKFRSQHQKIQNRNPNQNGGEWDKPYCVSIAFEWRRKHSLHDSKMWWWVIGLVPTNQRTHGWWWGQGTSTLQ